MAKRTDATLRAALVRVLLAEPDRELAGAVLDRWDELTEGAPMPELLGAIKSGTQKQVIPLYAAEIRRQSPAVLAGPAWAIINGAIVGRWSLNALQRIKKAAWALIDER